MHILTEQSNDTYHGKRIASLLSMYNFLMANVPSSNVTKVLVFIERCVIGYTQSYVISVAYHIHSIYGYIFHKMRNSRTLSSVDKRQDHELLILIILSMYPIPNVRRRDIYELFKLMHK